ncbi:hypothetical protein ACN1NW_000403 [Acinetobacter baumannii]|nr:hypothetical protein [Acinetobacter baumannii]ELA7030992.1 hypothetical protein [Acinetobacter baumannii]ELA7118755.1 hypothetical protein [Acinetobacter baumannii]ELB0919704.1 hypothetical protein [Acinetobacter baumannii]ELB0965880.1 hypothetical protein [Acinetobacter baumannii]
MTLDENEALIIGYDYEAGAESDTDIDSLLGHDTMLFEGKPIRCDDTGCFEAPKYSEDIELTKLELEKLELDPLIVPVIPYSVKKTRKPAKDVEHKFAAMFEFGGEQCVTRPCESENEALACVLWYALSYFY